MSELTSSHCPARSDAFMRCEMCVEQILHEHRPVAALLSQQRTGEPGDALGEHRRIANFVFGKLGWNLWCLMTLILTTLRRAGAGCSILDSGNSVQASLDV